MRLRSFAASVLLLLLIATTGALPVSESSPEKGPHDKQELATEYVHASSSIGKLHVLPRPKVWTEGKFDGKTLETRSGESSNGMTSVGSDGSQNIFSGSRTRSRSRSDSQSVDQSGNLPSSSWSSLTASSQSDWPATPSRVVVSVHNSPIAPQRSSGGTMPYPRSAVRQTRGKSFDSHDRKPYPSLVSEHHTKLHEGFKKALKPSKVIKKRPVIRVNDEYRAKFKNMLSSILRGGEDRTQHRTGGNRPGSQEASGGKSRAPNEVKKPSLSEGSTKAQREYQPHNDRGSSATRFRAKTASSSDTEASRVAKRAPLSASRLFSGNSLFTSSGSEQRGRQDTRNTFTGFSHTSLFPDEQRHDDGHSITAHPSPPRTPSRSPSPSTSAPHSADTRGSVHLPPPPRRQYSSDSLSVDSTEPKARKPKRPFQRKPGRLKGFFKALRGVKRIKKPQFGKFKKICNAGELSQRDFINSEPSLTGKQNQRNLNSDLGRLESRSAPQLKGEAARPRAVPQGRMTPSSSGAGLFASDNAESHYQVAVAAAQAAGAELITRAPPASWKSLINSAYRSTAIMRPLHAINRKIRKKKPSTILAYKVPDENGHPQLRLAPPHRNRLQRLANFRSRVRTHPPGFPPKGPFGRSPSPTSSADSNEPSPLSPRDKIPVGKKTQVSHGPVASQQSPDETLYRRVATTDAKWSTKMFNKDVAKEAPLHGPQKGQGITKKRHSSALMLMRKAGSTTKMVAQKPWQSFRASLESLRKHRKDKAMARKKFTSSLTKPWKAQIEANAAAKAVPLPAANAGKKPRTTAIGTARDAEATSPSELSRRRVSETDGTLDTALDEKREGSTEEEVDLMTRVAPTGVKGATRILNKAAQKGKSLRTVKNSKWRGSTAIVGGGRHEKADYLPTTKQSWPPRPWRSFRANLEKLKKIRKPKDSGRKKLVNSLSATWVPKAKASAASARSVPASTAKADLKSSPVLTNTFKSTATSRWFPASPGELFNVDERQVSDYQELELRPRVATEGSKWVSKVLKKDAVKDAMLRKVADKKIGKTKGNSAILTTPKLPDARAFSKTKQQWPQKPFQSFRANLDKLRKMRAPKMLARKKVGRLLHRKWSAKVTPENPGAFWDRTAGRNRATRPVVGDNWGSSANSHRKPGKKKSEETTDEETTPPSTP